MVDFIHKLAEIYGISHKYKEKHIQTSLTDLKKRRKTKSAKPRKTKVKRRGFKMPKKYGFIKLHFAMQDYITLKAYNVNVDLKEIANKNRVKVITLVSAINVIKKVENTIV